MPLAFSEKQGYNKQATLALVFQKIKRRDKA